MRIGLVESLGKRITVTIENLTRLVRRVDQLERAAQSVAPGADNSRHLALEGPAIQLGHRSARATDDEMHAHQRPFAGKKRIKSRNASMKCARQVLADLRADMTVVAFARHEHER